MNVDNFLVRPARQWVETYSDWDAWQQLTPEKAGDIAHHLAGLPSAERDDDEDAKRFDLILLRLQLARLDGDAVLFERLRKQVQDIASALLGQTAIPSVKAQEQLLDELSGDEWWVDVTLPMLELARRRIRALVRFVEKTKRAVVYSNFADELGEGSIVELPGVTPGTNWERFRAKARAYLTRPRGPPGAAAAAPQHAADARGPRLAGGDARRRPAPAAKPTSPAPERSHTDSACSSAPWSAWTARPRPRRSTATCPTPRSRPTRSGSSTSSSNT